MSGINGQPEGLHLLIVALWLGLPPLAAEDSEAPDAPAAVYSVFAMPVETEIKFRVDDLAGLAERLEAAGFSLHTPRAFESNVLYDTPDRAMRARTEILRIRSYAGRWTVTHKRLPDVGPGEDTHKHRIETETEVADGAAMAEVFLSLGLVAAFRYEKWRTEWSDGQGHCVVDETPIGHYAELEGSAEWIDRAAPRLGVDPAQYITLSYGRLFEQWRQQHGSAAEDLTFAATAAGDAPAQLPR
jgi:adenylate cyclase class 2